METPCQYPKFRLTDISIVPFISCKNTASREGFLAMQGINTDSLILCAIFSSGADHQETQFARLFPCLVFVTF